MERLSAKIKYQTTQKISSNTPSEWQQYVLDYVTSASTERLFEWFE